MLQARLCCFIVAFLALTNCERSFQFPPFSPFDVEGAVVWKCHYHGPKEVKYRELFDHVETEILHAHEDWITILSSTLQKDSLTALNLHPCYQISNISELIAMEWEQNFNRWQVRPGQYWDGTKSVKNGGRVLRSVLEYSDVNSGSLSYNFNHYKNYSAMVDWYEALAEQHPSVMTIHSIGKSYHGRDISAIRFAARKQELSTMEKPIVYIQCLIHSREWITGPVCMYIARQLTGKNNQMLDKLEVVMVPIANPDGYYLTWYNYPKYRLWRKNVEPISGAKCVGVDLNRNYDSHWYDNFDPNTDNECSTVYRGSSPASSMEVRALTKFIGSLGHRAVGFLDIHSFHQKIFYPPAWKDQNPKDIGVLHSVAEAMADAMGRVGAVYTPMRMVDLYAASGTFADWLLDYRKSARNCQSLIPITVELRPSVESVDKNYFTSGFLLPPREIIPTCTEMFAGFEEFAKQVTRTGKNCLKASHSQVTL